VSTTTDRLTFDQLCRIEPGLRRLEADVIAAAKVERRKQNRCANRVWFGRFGGGFKQRVVGLVGWHRFHKAGPPELGTQHAYDVVYDHLYRLLPDCRNCGCW
jgi:hypothetical protein